MKKILFLFVAIFNVICLMADIAPGVLQKYRNRVFVNTGIGASMNFAQALRADFFEIYLIEEKKLLVDHFKSIKAKRLSYFKPKNLQKCEIYHADSKTVLSDIIAPINEPITFFLCTCVPEYKEYDKENGILLELNQIMRHPIKTHTILIDYIHHAGAPSFGSISLEAVKSKLLEINPTYKFRFERGGFLEKEDNAVLVAYIPR